MAKTAFGLEQEFVDRMQQPGFYGLVVFRAHRERTRFIIQFHRAFDALGAKWNASSGTVTFPWGAVLLLYAKDTDEKHARIRGTEFSAVEFTTPLGCLEESFIRSRVRKGELSNA